MIFNTFFASCSLEECVSMAGRLQFQAINILVFFLQKQCSHAACNNVCERMLCVHHFDTRYYMLAEIQQYQREQFTLNGEKKICLRIKIGSRFLPRIV